jgi:hypothetical protein
VTNPETGRLLSAGFFFHPFERNSPKRAWRVSFSPVVREDVRLDPAAMCFSHQAHEVTTQVW